MSSVYVRKRRESKYEPIIHAETLRDGEQVVGTITVIDTFLGAILGISTVQYNKKE